MAQEERSLFTAIREIQLQIMSIMIIHFNPRLDAKTRDIISYTCIFVLSVALLVNKVNISISNNDIVCVGSL